MSHADHPNNGHLKVTDSDIAPLLIAAASLENNDPNLCINLLVKVLEADSKNPTATQKWIVILNRFQEESGIELVISIYKKYEAYIGGNPELLWNFGERLEESGSLDEAIKRYEAAASLQEDHRKRLNEKVNAVCPQFLQRGDSELSNGEYSKAITSFETVLKYKPDDLEAKEKLEEAKLQEQIREFKSQCKNEEQNIKEAMKRIVHDCSIKRNSEHIKSINGYLSYCQQIISEGGMCDQKCELPVVVHLPHQINGGFINREWEIPENQRLKEENQRLKEENQRLREENCKLSSKDIDLSTKRLQAITTLALKIAESENELSNFEENGNEHQNNKSQYFISSIKSGLNLYEQNYPRHARFFLHRVTSSLSEDSINPSMIGILLELASAYYRIGDWMEGEKLWKILDDNQAVTQPENIQKWIDVLFAKGNYLFACKKWKPAVDVFQKAIDLFDKSPDSTSAYLKWQILYKLGKAFHYQGIWIKAGEYYSRTLGLLSKIKQSLESNFPNDSHPSVENIEKVEKILDVNLKLDEVAEQIKILLEDHDKIENSSSMMSF